MIEFGIEDVYYCNTVHRVCIEKNLPTNILKIINSNLGDIEKNLRMDLGQANGNNEFPILGIQVYVETKTNVREGYNFIITYPNINELKNLGEIDEKTKDDIVSSIRWLNGYLNYIYKKLNN